MSGPKCRNCGAETVEAEWPYGLKPYANTRYFVCCEYGCKGEEVLYGPRLSQTATKPRWSGLRRHAEGLLVGLGCMLLILVGHKVAFTDGPIDQAAEIAKAADLVENATWKLDTLAATGRTLGDPALYWEPLHRTEGLRFGDSGPQSVVVFDEVEPLFEIWVRGKLLVQLR